MKHIRLFLIVCVVSIISSCGKKEFENSQLQTDDLPVVESYLSPGATVKLKVNTPSTYVDDELIETIGINGLNITFNINDQAYQMLESDTVEGLYYLSDSSVTLSEGDVCSFTFEYNEVEVTSTTIVPAKPSSVRLTKTSIYTARMETSTGPPSGGFSLDTASVFWQNDDQSDYVLTIEYLDDDFDVINDRFSSDDSVFSTQPTRQDQQVLRVGRELPYFGNYRIVLFHINPEYTSLFESVGDNSINITASTSNIEYGLGIFTSYQTDSLMINIIEE